MIECIYTPLDLAAMEVIHLLNNFKVEWSQVSKLGLWYHFLREYLCT